MAVAEVLEEVQVTLEQNPISGLDYLVHKESTGIDPNVFFQTENISPLPHVRIPINGKDHGAVSAMHKEILEERGYEKLGYQDIPVTDIVETVLDEAFGNVFKHVYGLTNVVEGKVDKDMELTAHIVEGETSDTYTFHLNCGDTDFNDNGKLIQGIENAVKWVNNINQPLSNKEKMKYDKRGFFLSFASGDASGFANNGQDFYWAVDIGKPN